MDSQEVYYYAVRTLDSKLDLSELKEHIVNIVVVMIKLMTYIITPHI